MYYVYLLVCSDVRTYIGSTNDLKDRINRYNKGQVSATKDRFPLKLIAYFAFSDKYTAFNFEKYPKSGSDIPHLVSCDQLAYSKYGADEKYFHQKLLSPDTHILVVEEEAGPTGFCVFEILDPGQIPKDFCDLRLTEPIDRKWMHIIAFTTKTNYADTDSDTQLLKASEKNAQKNGCEIFCVPLTPPGKHPFDDAIHDVFGFWDRNGYKRTGRLKWHASPTEKVECTLYMKRNIPELI